jgi:uncharacterized protein (TIGR03083 family)
MMTPSITTSTTHRMNVADIPPLTHAGAGPIAQTEYTRLLAVLEALSGDDWEQPTYCSEWNVRDMVAHIAGAVAGSSSFAEFKRQNIDAPYGDEVNEPVDGTNRLQIEERAQKTTAELVAEFRELGQVAVRNRQRLPWIIRKLRAPMGSLGFASFEYLMDTIYPRDQWMHRYDICAATGRQMVVTPEHDGRIVALVLKDIHKKLRQQLRERPILLRLTGAVTGEYVFGRGVPKCDLAIDFFDFNLRASGRIGANDALGKTAVRGDQAAADWFIHNCEVMY